MIRQLAAGRRKTLWRVATLAGAGGLACIGLYGVSAAQAVPAGHGQARVWIAASRTAGDLDCNGMSPVQKTILAAKACTDIRGALGIKNKYTWDGRFYDNGRYIGHDEPDVRFLSSARNSGNNVYWNETLGRDPAKAPTVRHPGHDVNHWAELTIAPWFSMALCNPFSYPLLPCQPKSDVNAPAQLDTPVPAGVYPGGGSSFLEMQFYPPGMAPFQDNISCNNKDWCASLHINDLECSENFASCNNDCEEPTNFAFIQTNGVPTGPPSPQLSNLATGTPNRFTLLMRPGDHLRIHIFDAPVPGGKPGEEALVTSIHDLTTGKTGFMQASAKNGFMATNINDCSGTPWDYQPEYNTAGPRNVVPWGADLVDVSTEFEIGHFEACSRLTKPLSVDQIIPGYTDITWNECHGPYENSVPKKDESTEPGDAFCYPVGDTHLGQAPPNIVTGCEDDVFQNGDLDYDGNSYWPDWPNSVRPTRFPSTFLESPPVMASGAGYSRFQIQTDAALSEASCKFPDTSGCKVPPPGGPGKFYPYWTLTHGCIWEFGQVQNGNTFGKEAQYGSVPPGLGYPQLLGPIMKNSCRS
jgi:hypothetical protein